MKWFSDRISHRVKILKLEKKDDIKNKVNGAKDNEIEDIEDMENSISIKNE